MNSLIYRALNTLKPTSACIHRLAAARLTGTSPIASVRCDGTAKQTQGAPEIRKGKEFGKRTKSNSRSMKLTIAVEGCCHGELDKIYATLQFLEKREGKKIDLLLCCGDFQAVRNLDDLETMACPPKYRSMQSFYKYYSGERKAPIPTIFIGGNHEAANHLWELYYGGWVAPNIYFLGSAGAVKFGGLRIAGISGIYKHHDYRRGHHEFLPYNDSMKRSIYHIRDFEVYRLLQLQKPVDIFLSHDWPTGITRYGDEARLLSRKVYLRADVESGTLGSPLGAQLLEALRPAYWFAAHMHVKFAAVVQHARPGATSSQRDAAAVRLPTAPTADGGSGPGPNGAAERGVGEGEEGGGGGGDKASASSGGFPSTRFLALDKCLPGRDFLQVIEVDAPGPPELHYDEEWLAILRTTHHLTNLGFKHSPLPGMGGLRSGPQPEDLEFVRQALAARGTTRVPDNFAVTAVPYNPALGQRSGRMPQRHIRNPQSVALLDMLGLPYNLEHTAAASGPSSSGRAPLSWTGQGQAIQQPRPFLQGAPVPHNPEEIDLGELDEDAEQANEGQQLKGNMVVASGEIERHESQMVSGGQTAADAEGDVRGSASTLADDPMFKPLHF